MTFTVKVSGSGGRLNRAAWQVAAREWTKSVGPVVKQELQAKAPVRTGGLRKSVRYRSNVLASRAVMTFTAVDYARFVIDGTAAHEIRPRNKQALFWAGADHPVTVVHHPGTRANDFVRRAIEPLRPAIQAAMDAAVAAALKP